METTMLDDDLDYYDLPIVDPSEFYEPGQCLLRKNPYAGEPERMILSVDVKSDSYLAQAVYENGEAGPMESIMIRDAHFYYDKV